MYHSFMFVRPATWPVAWARLISFQRVARPCAPVGAVVTTNASPGAWLSIHQATARAAVKLLPDSWQEWTDVRRLSRIERRFSACLLHRGSPKRRVTQGTGSRPTGARSRLAARASGSGGA